MDGARLRAVPGAAAPATDGQVRDEANALIGTVLDRRYRLEEMIGEGGMGLVFRATHVLIGKSFAIKVLRREYLDVPDVARRFVLEAQVASNLKHPNVVEISDFGETPDGAAYYVMELLHGSTLAVEIDTSGAMPVAKACAIALQIAQGLEAAHACGVVHRDLKPDNVFLCSPRKGSDELRVKLLDFGIARAGPRRLTVTGALLGTPEYLSPEMALGREVDPRADLYALGIILFEMLTGRVPYYAKEVARVLEMHIVGTPPHLVDRRPELAALTSLDGLIQDLLKKAPDERPASAQDVVARLGGALREDPSDDTADHRVQRSTLTIGSNAMPEADVVTDAGHGWEEPSGWTPGQATPTPTPLPAATSASIVGPIAIGVGVALGAAGIFLAIAQPWRTPLHPAEPPSVVFERPEPPEPTAAPPRPRPRKPLEPLGSMADRTAAAPMVLNPSPPPAAPAPEVPDVTPIADEPPAHEARPAEAVERSKQSKRKQPKLPVEEPPKDAPPEPRVVPPPPEPEPKVPQRPSIDDRSPKPPGDLKDPFQAN